MAIVVYQQKYDELHEAIKLVIPAIELVEDTAARLATHGKIITFRIPT